jgi:hypothetical protein
VVYPLDEVLLLCLLAMLGGSETFVDIARFGEKKLGLLRRFRPFRDGTPSHDHLGDIFAMGSCGSGACRACLASRGLYEIAIVGRAGGAGSRRSPLNDPVSRLWRAMNRSLL